MTAERNWWIYENFTRWIGGYYPRHPKDNAEFFGRQYPWPLIDNEVEAYSDELAKVTWEMYDKRWVWSNSCIEIIGRNCARSYVLYRFV